MLICVLYQAIPSKKKSLNTDIKTAQIKTIFNYWIYLFV